MIKTKNHLYEAMAQDMLAGVIHRLSKFVPAMDKSAMVTATLRPQLNDDEYGPRVPVVAVAHNVFVTAKLYLSSDTAESAVQYLRDAMRRNNIDLADVPTVYVEYDREGEHIKFRFTVPTILGPL